MSDHFTIGDHRRIAGGMKKSDKIGGLTQAALHKLVRDRQPLPGGVSYAPGEAVAFVPISGKVDAPEGKTEEEQEKQEKQEENTGDE